MSHRNLLSGTIVQANYLLHSTINSELQSLSRVGRWTQRQQLVITQNETAAMFSIFSLVRWFIGIGGFYDALSKKSKVFSTRAGFMFA
jgi:hypothetical protein